MGDTATGIDHPSAVVGNMRRILKKEWRQMTRATGGQVMVDPEGQAVEGPDPAGSCRTF